MKTTIFLTAACGTGYLVAPRNWALAPTHFENFQPATYMFMHAGPDHLATNLLGLAVLGPAIERRRSGWELLGLFVVAGVVSGLVEYAANPDFSGRILGASGAISALVGPAFCGLRRTAWLVLPLLFWYAFQVLSPADGSHAHYAHLSGLAVGLIWASFWKNNSDN